jgi:hypothetical protein
MPDNPDDLIRELRDPLAYIFGWRLEMQHEDQAHRLARYERLLRRVDAYLSRNDGEQIAALRKLVNGETNG